MKKSILLSILIFSNVYCFAKFKFGVTAGVQFSSVRITNYNTDTRFSFNAGGVALTNIAQDIDVQVQLLLSGKGYVYNDQLGYKSIVRPMYLELPVVFRFKLNTSNDVKVFLGGGGYIAYGIAGSKIYYDQGYQKSEKIHYGNDHTDDLEPLDFGLTFQFGVDFKENHKGYFFYDLGLSKTVPNTTYNSFNRVFGFNLSWYFGSASE